MFYLEFVFFHSFCILGDDELINAVLNITVEKGIEVVDGVVDSVIGDTPLREVVGADLGRSVSPPRWATSTTV